MSLVAARPAPRLGLHVEVEEREGVLVRVSLVRESAHVAREGENAALDLIVRHLETGREDLAALPLRMAGGPFEQEALRIVHAIPPGETLTYGEIAKRLGKPGAARAVGQACARNPLILVIPCHRVVQGGGGLGQYSGEGGVDTKRRLLELEGAIPRSPLQARLL